MTSTDLNSTLILPPGTSNHGNPHLVCFPAKWTDVVIFFIGNYVAHAATTITAPGLPPTSSFLNIVQIVLFPIIGVSAGFSAIGSRAVFAPTDLRKAARAGALCCVVREEDQINTIENMRLTGNYQPEWFAKAINTRIHGRIHLPPGFCLAKVSHKARFVDDDDSPLPMTLCSQYSFVKILVSIGQLLFSIATLYRTRGDQIDRFGYAAFGLTVIQYGLMSLINLVGNLFSPQYPTVYLVKSDAMRTAKESGGVFEGVVGVIKGDANLPTRGHSIWERQFAAPGSSPLSSPMDIIWILVCLIPTGVNILILWSLTRFKPGGSSLKQQVLIMTWLGIGSCRGILGRRVGDKPQAHIGSRSMLKQFVIQRFVDLVMGGIVIAAWWVVAQEIRDYGVCMRVL